MTSALRPIDLNDPVTRHVRRDFIQLDARQSVGEALASIRASQPEGRIIYFYVADAEGRLCGVVPTRRLLLSAPETSLADIMVRQVVAIPASATVLDACEFFTLHRLLAFPVVDDQRRVIGLVDVEMYTAELNDLDDLERREDSDELFQLIGVHLTEAQQRSALVPFRQRFPWLLCNIAGGLLAAFFSKVYQAELAWQGAVLALFIPVVLALAESVSVQSVSLTLRTLQVQRPTWSALAGKAGWELLTGLFLGGACGLLVGLAALVWIGQAGVALCLLGGIAGGVAGAAVIGFTLPAMLRLLRRDPQVAAGPVALAASDMLTLLLYFNLARWLLM